MDEVKPQYYKFVVKGVEMDVLDVARAMELPFTLSLAMKYFRKKGDWQKQVSDLKKCRECIDREIEFIEFENKKIPF